MKIYLCAPYSHTSTSVIENRVMRINRKAAELMGMGHIVFSPISHSHGISFYTKADALDHKFWLSQDLPFIEWCDEVWIYCLPGFEDSRGIKSEIEQANRLKKPIKHIKVINGKD